MQIVALTFLPATLAALHWPSAAEAFTTTLPTMTASSSAQNHLTTLMSSTATTYSESVADGRRIVIVGGGIGGLSTAFDSRHLLRPQDEIVVVSDREKFQFTPSNPWVAVRKRTAEDISLSLAEILPKHKIVFIHGKARTLSPKKNQLILEDGTKVPYNYLVIATGPRLGFDEIPGARGIHHHTASICTTPHALLAAETYDKLIKEPGPIVIGATQGASCFGPAYEYAMLVEHELKKRGGRKLVEQCPIHFITPEPYIGHLGLGGAGESEKILTRMLDERHIKYTANCKVQRVNPGSVSIQYYDEHDQKINDVLPSHLTMLVPPFRGIDAWKTVTGLTDEHGMILVDKHQQSTTYSNIFGVGVCVHIDPLEETKVPTGVPKTGYSTFYVGLLKYCPPPSIPHLATLSLSLTHTHTHSFEFHSLIFYSD